MKVNPDQIANCGRRLDDSGVVWQQRVTELEPPVADMSSFGSDLVGSALQGVYSPLVPTIIDYAEQTGVCVRETATGLQHMAEAYRTTEDNSTAEAEAISAVLDSIGAS